MARRRRRAAGARSAPASAREQQEPLAAKVDTTVGANGEAPAATKAPGAKRSARRRHKRATSEGFTPPATIDVPLLAATLGLEVRDERWFRQAFSHASYVNERADSGMASNERLEFLGDAVLSLVVGRYFFEQYPDLAEGDLSRLRAAVVRSSTLAARAKALELGRYALLGKGEEQAAGRRRPGFLADLFEALLGAIFLDSGLGAAAEFILTCLNEEMQVAAEGKRHANFKAQLQEAVQRRGSTPITYEVVAAEGPDHEKRWTCDVRVGGRRCGLGTARSKKLAEQEAARQALLLGWGDDTARA